MFAARLSSIPFILLVISNIYSLEPASAAPSARLPVVQLECLGDEGIFSEVAEGRIGLDPYSSARNQNTFSGELTLRFNNITFSTYASLKRRKDRSYEIYLLDFSAHPDDERKIGDFTSVNFLGVTMMGGSSIRSSIYLREDNNHAPIESYECRFGIVR